MFDLCLLLLCGCCGLVVLVLFGFIAINSVVMGIGIWCGMFDFLWLNLMLCNLLLACGLCSC